MVNFPHTFIYKFLLPLIAYCGNTTYRIGMFDTVLERGDCKLLFDTKILTFLDKKFLDPKKSLMVPLCCFLRKKTFCREKSKFWYQMKAYNLPFPELYQTCRYDK